MHKPSKSIEQEPADEPRARPKRGLLQYIFQDNTGRYISGQPPNIPIVLVVIGLIGILVSPQGSVAAQLCSLFAFGAIFLWSYLEVMYGESLFRKILGAVVFVGVFAVTLR